MSKLKDFTTTILRKIRKLEYKNVKLIPGYEKSEEEYSSLKHALTSVDVMIKDLMSYEYGSRLLKMIKNGMEKISEKSALNVYKNRDIFEEMSQISRRVSMMSIDSEGRRTAEVFSDLYRRVSESKRKLNARLESLRLQLKEKKQQCSDIDKSRKKIKNMRYDLEILLQDEGYNGEIREAEKKEFSAFSSQVLRSMIQFVEDAYIGKLLSSLSKEYADHLSEISEILKPVK